MDREKILFPPLHINLGLIKQFTKALDKDGDCFTYFYQAFPWLTMEKLKAGIFDGPQIRLLIRDLVFENSMYEVELEVWKAFVRVVKNFLGNNKARNYTELVNNMLTAFRNLGCNMSVKIHNLFSHMDQFPENLKFNDEATYNLRVLTFINADHYVYSNWCFYHDVGKHFFLLKTYLGWYVLKKSVDNATKM